MLQQIHLCEIHRIVANNVVSHPRLYHRTAYAFPIFSLALYNLPGLYVATALLNSIELPMYMYFDCRFFQSFHSFSLVDFSGFVSVHSINSIKSCASSENDTPNFQRAKLVSSKMRLNNSFSAILLRIQQRFSYDKDTPKLKQSRAIISNNTRPRSGSLLGP